MTSKAASLPRLASLTSRSSLRAASTRRERGKRGERVRVAASTQGRAFLSKSPYPREYEAAAQFLTMDLTHKSFITSSSRSWASLLLTEHGWGRPYAAAPVTRGTSRSIPLGMRSHVGTARRRPNRRSKTLVGAMLLPRGIVRRFTRPVRGPGGEEATGEQNQYWNSLEV